MSKPMSAMLTSVRDRLDEATAAFWTDEQLRRWIMEGAADIARRTQSLQDRMDVTVTAGVQEYTAPADAIKVYRAEYRRTGDNSVYPLTYMDFQNMDQVWYTSQAVTQGTPDYYTFWGFPPNLKLVLYPTPSASGTCKVFYYRLPAAIASDGTQDANQVEIPSGWEDVIADYAEFMALRKDRDPAWQDAKAQYTDRLEAMYDNTIRWTDQAGMIVPESGSSAIPQFLWDEGY